MSTSCSALQADQLIRNRRRPRVLYIPCNYFRHQGYHPLTEALGQCCNRRLLSTGFPSETPKLSKLPKLSNCTGTGVCYVPYHTSASDLLPERCHDGIPFLPQSLRMAEEVLCQRTVIQDPTTEAEFDKGLLPEEARIQPLA